VVTVDVDIGNGAVVEAVVVVTDSAMVAVMVPIMFAVRVEVVVTIRMIDETHTSTGRTTMSRMNVFVQAGNDNRDVSIGGRQQSNSGYCILNTDNAYHSDVSIRVDANVLGNGTTYKDRQKHGDDRETVFTVELPEAKKMDAGCQVRIEQHGHRWEGLIAIGTMLCGMKAAEQAMSGDVERAKMTLDTVKEICRELDEKKSGKGYENVILPGGVSLAKALYCVEIVRQITEEGGSPN
jgi:hypothetical protein